MHYFIEPFVNDIIHPSLTAVSLDQDVNTNKELIGHGYSNLIAGMTGSVFVSVDSMHDIQLI